VYTSAAMPTLPRIVRLPTLVLLLSLTVASVAHGQALSAAPPDALGMSAARLARLTETMKRYVDENKVAGTVTIVLRDGRIAYFESEGLADREQKRPMQKDTIFRIASMSKAVTSVAVMMLEEEGRLLLNDPVSKFIPAFKTTTVAVPPPANAALGSPVAIVPARRQITIRDLLTHTSGVSYGSGPTRPQYQAAGFDDWYFADKSEPIGVWIEKLATLPFDQQPGEAYVYGYNTDILGYVVEKASGMPLDQFFRTRIFEPLKMADTSFFLPPEKRDRLATVYAASGGVLARAQDTGRFQGAYADGPRVTFSGGAGLLSTAPDFARFMQMLLNGGELEGVRLLSPTTVALMTSSHTGTLYAEGRFGFGLGFEITEHVGRSGRPGSVGEFGWGGAYFTKYWADPQEKLVVVFMTQLLPSGGLDLQDKLRALVYQAIEVPGRELQTAPVRRTSARPRS
jgi:CubicO group peptidase (beta-lactamase class C family)